MRKTGRMLMMAGQPQNKDRRFSFGYEDRPSNNYPRDDYRGGYEAEDKFRDKRGREHYDNGRYAPMRNDGGGYAESRYDGGERNRDRDGRYTAQNRYDSPQSNRQGYDIWYDPATRSRPRNMIGFERENEGAQSHYGEHESGNEEMSHMTGNIVPMTMGKTSVQFTPEIAREWTANMENEDGTKGPHWSFEQAKQIVEQRGINFDPYVFWAVLNAVYSDDVKIAKKHNINTMDYYIDRALSWLKDKDAVKDKAAAYYEYVVKH